MALMRRENTDLKKANADKAAAMTRIGAMLSIQTTRGRIVMGMSTLLTAGTALGGGALDGYLEAKAANTIGPVKMTSLAGLAGAVTGLVVDDVVLGEFMSAAARGLVAGPAWEAGRSWGLGKGSAAPAPAPATTTPAKR